MRLFLCLILIAYEIMAVFGIDSLRDNVCGLTFIAYEIVRVFGIDSIRDCVCFDIEKLKN